MHATINRTMDGRVWLMLLALSLLWGGSFYFIGVAVIELPALTIVSTRVALAAIVLWAVIAVTGVSVPSSAQAWQAFAMMGILNNIIPFTLIVWGQTYIESGLASILNATTPLSGIVLAGLLLPDERLNRAKLTGVLIGFVGVVFMIGPQALGGLGVDLLAQLAVLGAALSYGFAGVYGRRFKSMGVHPTVTAAGQVSTSALLLIPISIYVDQPFSLPMPSAAVCLSMLGLGLLSTALAYILYFKILASAGASNLLLVTFLIPVSAVLLGYLLLDERLQANHFVGMALIGGGLLAIDGRLWSIIVRRRSDTP